MIKIKCDECLKINEFQDEEIDISVTSYMGRSGKLAYHNTSERYYCSYCGAELINLTVVE